MDRALETAARRIPVNGTELFVSTQGRAGAPWVVLLNSMAADTSMWAPQVAALARGGYRVLCMDWRGHGGSRDEPAPYTLEMLSADVLATMEAIGVTSPHLAGTSLGGMVAMLLAIEQPVPLASLTVCSALPRIAPAMAQAWSGIAARVRRDGVAEAVDGTISRWFTPAYAQANPAVVEHTRRMIESTTPDAYTGCIAAFRNLDLFEELSRIAIPALFMVGENDPASTPEIMRGMHERVPGSRFEIVRDAAHLPSLEQPEAVSRVLLEFFGSVQEPCVR